MMSEGKRQPRALAGAVLLTMLCAAWAASAFFFFNDTATPEIYTLSLHDALPIDEWTTRFEPWATPGRLREPLTQAIDRKSTRLNSSHVEISYAVFCLKKKKS